MGPTIANSTAALPARSRGGGRCEKDAGALNDLNLRDNLSEKLTVNAPILCDENDVELLGYGALRFCEMFEKPAIEAVNRALLVRNCTANFGAEASPLGCKC